RGALSEVAGIHWCGSDGIVSNPCRDPIENLDDLPFPMEALGCFDPKVYLDSGTGRAMSPGGMMTSRGCPARCTFCANYVTGRIYRWRSVPNVLAEMRRIRAEFGVSHFPFWDDAFTARRSRLLEFCEALSQDSDLRGVTWTCITPANMVRAADLPTMRAAGCVAINFGIESGDYNVLRSIKKGQRPEQVQAAVEAAKAAGMTTIVNFMFGFPGEGPEELRNTFEFMQNLAPYTDIFNNRGVLVPFPGTPVYESHREEFGFTDWWMRPEMVPDEVDVFSLSPIDAQEYLEKDSTLELDFFGYESNTKVWIERCVRFKALHNRRAMLAPSQAEALELTVKSLRRDAAASVG
ncbi:MAG: radical SAM protein, partial [Myxococcales bacterium]|nr:radical SAM protein [Myxococcales bacterium]